MELKPGKGAQLMRSAGTSAQLAGLEGAYALVRMRSGEMRKILASCRACIGEVANSEHNLRSLGKAGANRWRGIRPTVRGTAMNPVDHVTVVVKVELVAVIRYRRMGCRLKVIKPGVINVHAK